MKKLLIIVHLPRTSPRIDGLVKNLPEFGWEPIILTGVTSKYASLPTRIVETPYRNSLGFLGRLLKLDPEKDAMQQIKNRFGIISKGSPGDFFLSLGGEIINYPCPDKNWKPFALKAAHEILQKENIGAVISSSPPVTSHLISSELKADHKIPWIADIRDLWSQNHNYRYSPLRRALDRRIELKTLSKANALITVSEPWGEKLRTLHKGKSVYVITHGFDPAEVNIPPAKLTAKFTITYTGSLYKGAHDPSKLLIALRDLISEGGIDPDDIETRFYGYKHVWLDKEIKHCGLSGLVKQYGQVPRDVALQKQRESQLLLRLSWEGREKAGYAGKLFEYLAAQRPILATGLGNDMTKELLDETKAGIYSPTVEDIKNTLRELYQEYRFRGEVAYKGDESKINRYTHREMARKFCEILDSRARN
ncbi:glycosyltransferase [Chloroflexota bacterium]